MGLLFRGKDIDEETYVRLKGEADAVLDAVMSHSSGRKNKVLGYAKPASIGDLGGKLPTEFSQSLGDELRWSVATALRYRDDIKTFLVQKEEIEQLMLSAEWEEAVVRKRAADAKLGHSMWSVEVELYINQQIGGLEANRKMLKELTKTTHMGWSRVLCHFYSHKAEDTISSEEYAASTRVLQASPEEGAPRARFRRYLQFKVNPNRFDGTEDLAFFLYMEEAHSVYDRYLVLKQHPYAPVRTRHYRPRAFSAPKHLRQAAPILVGEPRAYGGHITQPTVPRRPHQKTAQTTNATIPTDDDTGQTSRGFDFELTRSSLTGQIEAGITLPS